MFLIFILISVVSTQTVREDIKSHANWKILDREEDCGHSSADRIIGGYTASLGQYPWIARIGYMANPNPNNITVSFYGCGGTIISERYILSAAHCHPKLLPGIPIELEIELVQVRLGEYNVKKTVDCVNWVCAPPAQDIFVEEYICHGGFTNDKRQDDICLIRLKEPIQFSRYVYPICLPVYKELQTENFDKLKMEVAGWGIEDIVSNKESEILQTLKVPIVPTVKCRQIYRNKVILTHKQMCAGAVIGKDSCGGDSGGPLMAPLSVKAPPRYFLVGIVSFGPEKCAVFNVPGVYTKVSEYLTWILDNVRK